MFNFALFVDPVSQDHRFDLAKEYGCSPSIHNSWLALAFIWIPPLILCSITLAISCTSFDLISMAKPSFIHAGYSFHHTTRVSYSQFVVHIESRTDITSSIFFRQLSTILIMTVVLLVTVIFSVFSAPALVPWSSWSAVHSLLWKVNVVTAAEQLNNKRVGWWIFFTVSVLYIFLSFSMGEETRDGFRWVVLQLRKKRQLPKMRKLHLPLL